MDDEPGNRSRVAFEVEALWFGDSGVFPDDGHHAPVPVGESGAEIMGAVGIAIVVGEGFGAVEPGKSSANDDDSLRAFHD